MIDGIPVVRDAFPRTVRLVSTARLRDSVLASLVAENEISDLAEIEGATSQRLVAQDRGSEFMTKETFVYGVPHAIFINAAFAYSKPLQPNRFNSTRGAWYAALDVETCQHEVKYHFWEFLHQADMTTATVHYTEMFASLAGEYLNLRAVPDHVSLNPDPAIGYPAGNALADTAHAQGLNGIVYPSVRHKGGTCFVALWPHAVQSVAMGDVYSFAWNGSPEPTIEKISSAVSSR